MTQHEKLFESLPPTRLFFRCALPSMISMAMLSLYTVADGIFVGRYVGPNALAAVNLVMPLIMMSFALVDLVAVGSSVQISIRLGEKNERAANRIFSFCTGLIVALSCVIGLGGFFLAGQMVSLMGAEAEVTAMGAEYMQVYAVFAPVIMVFFAVDNYLRICGRVRYSMILNVVTALLNIVLDFLFLVVFRWGVAAAAAASCLSIALGTVLGFLPFVMGRLPLRFVRGTISARQLGNILANGSSEFFSSIAGSVDDGHSQQRTAEAVRVYGGGGFLYRDVCGQHRGLSAVWYGRFHSARHQLQLRRLAPGQDAGPGKEGAFDRRGGVAGGFAVDAAGGTVCHPSLYPGG